MHIKIHFGSKPLFLCNAIDAEIDPYVHHDDAIFLDELNAHTIKTAVHEMESENVKAGVFMYSDLDALKKAFFRKFIVVRAAGGLVRDSDDKLLMIFRRGKWDLPKGKLDEGETLEQCAVREVREETGLHRIELQSPLTITWHVYHEGTRSILKESHWYNMRGDSAEPLIPQTEEDIHEIKWVDPSSLAEYLDNTFPSIVDVLKAGLTK